MRKTKVQAKVSQGCKRPITDNCRNVVLNLGCSQISNKRDNWFVKLYLVEMKLHACSEKLLLASVVFLQSSAPMFDWKRQHAKHPSSISKRYDREWYFEMWKPWKIGSYAKIQAKNTPTISKQCCCIIHIYIYISIESDKMGFFGVFHNWTCRWKNRL